MIVIATFFYLPGHVAEMLRRAWFYYAGDEMGVAGSGMGAGAMRGQGVGAGAGGGAGGVRQKGQGRSGGRMDGQDVLDMLGTL